MDPFSALPAASITGSLPPEPTPTLSTIYPAGAVPPIAGASPLPQLTIVGSLTNVVINGVTYPQDDVLPPTDSPQVQQWIQEVQNSGISIPSIPPTGNVDCTVNIAAASDKSRCWWTCGGCVGPNDISTCPSKLTWGVSFDDGPSDYTPKLLKFLDDHNLKATFFLVGSRVGRRPDTVRYELMDGHQLAVHTWSHPYLTNLTNEQVIAELGWSRQVIKDVTGITPRYMRPPYGDIDNRIRAISMAMGLTPILWTGSGATEFDTDDWRVPAGQVTGEQSFLQFQNILNNASTSLNTGFIVLEHDLYEETVDLAVGSFLPAALSHQPAFTLESINTCIGNQPAGAYVETSPKSNITSSVGTGSSASSSTKPSNSASPSPTKSSSASRLQAVSAFKDSTMTLGLGALVMSALVSIW